ncbi:MAG: hypothetical protein L6R28_07195 [Planctomycetes bacterium]|nr:hypothetical protein [Planctomycetota bacterium]
MIFEALSNARRWAAEKLNGKPEAPVNSTMAKLPLDVLEAMAEGEKAAGQRRRLERLAAHKRAEDERDTSDEARALRIESGWDDAQRARPVLDAKTFKGLCPSCGSRYVTRILEVVGRVQYRKCETCCYPFRTLAPKE